MDHPKLTPPDPNRPFESEEEWSRAATRTLEQQRQQSGGLPDAPADDPVRDSTPFTGLR